MHVPSLELMMTHSMTHRDDMTEENAIPYDEDALSLQSTSTRAVLEMVAKRRAVDDDEEGFFRDFADCRNPNDFKWGPELHLQLEKHASTGLRTWVDQLFARVSAVALTIVQGGSAQEVRALLIGTAALCVSWVEAIDRRKVDLAHRPKPMRAPPWWVKVYRWFSRGVR